MEDLPVLYVYSKTPPPLSLQIFVVIEPSPEVLFVVKHVYTVTIKFFFLVGRLTPSFLERISTPL